MPRSKLDWEERVLGKELQTKDSRIETQRGLESSDGVPPRIVCLYFSGSWCNPCRAFTPFLAKLYEDYQNKPDWDDDKEEYIGIEVVFVSSDLDAVGFNAYFAEMPWKAVPFEAEDVRLSLAQNFGVRGIPMLVVLDGIDGKVLHQSARQVLEKAGTFSALLEEGHPDYHAGRIGANPKPTAVKWDESFPKCHPKRSPVADSVRRAGSASLINRLTKEFPPPPRERALARSASLAQRGPPPAVAEHSNYHCDFDKFLKAISEPEKLPKFGPSDRQKSGEHNHMKDIGACQHYESMHEEFSRLLGSLKRDPKGTERFLANTGAWKYWGLQLESTWRCSGRSRCDLSSCRE